MKALLGGALATFILAACSGSSGSSGSSDSAGDEPDPTPESSASVPSEGTSSTPPLPAPDGRDLDVTRLVVPAAAETMPEAWQEQFVIGYGPGKELLGTSPGGDSGSLDIGPEFGAPGPDGTWWFLDGAKRRIAHYDASGRFLGQVRVRKELLVDGRYFQWALPHVLADGTLVATRFGPDRAWLLRLRDGVLDEIRVGGFFAPVFDDGKVLYGWTGLNTLAVVDPANGALRRVPSLRTPSGTPFLIAVGGRPAAQLRIDLPGSGVSKALPVGSSSGASAHVGVEVRAGADGTIHMLMYGAADDDESLQLVGATLVSPAGEVAQVEPLPSPFSDADSGSPAHLVMAPGSSEPALVYVLPDGVHVYARTG